MNTHRYFTRYATTFFTPVFFATIFFATVLIVSNTPLQASELSASQSSQPQKHVSLYTADAEYLTVSSLFRQMDSDKNGRIDPSEINKQSVLSHQFSTVDQNSNGSLDAREFEIFIAQVDI